MAEGAGRFRSGSGYGSAVEGKNRPRPVDQYERRRRGLSTPVTFSVALGTSSTTIYTGKSEQFLLIRHIAVVNSTGGALNLTITGGADTWVSVASIAANTAEVITALNGTMIADGDDLAGLGSAAGLRVFGWGLRIEGSTDWVL